MPLFNHADAQIYYEVHGKGFPILLLAPGGMRSSISFWDKVAWNPIEQLASSYQVIAMDQRNAGRSTAPIKSTDCWQTFTDDQVALLDHLNIERCHLAGMCIGGPYSFGLIQSIPQRIASAVIFQTIGLSDNRQVFLDLFDGWAEELKPAFPMVSSETWHTFRQAMFGGDFLFNVSEAFVSQCLTPLLVLMGDDIYHPQETSRKIAELAPQASLIEHWKEAEHMPLARRSVDEFLQRHTPSANAA